MKVVGLISGGKDSCYNLIQCIAAGHTIEALANLAPKNTDELDSYMYQSVGHMGIDLYADAMGLPLYRREIEGTSLNTKSIDYSPTDGDEVEDLYCLLKRVKEECDIEAVSVGAVLSDYQRVRVENVCQRLGLVSLAYMWRQDQSELLQEMIDCGIEAILIKVAAIGLSPSKHLGKTIEEMQSYLENLKEKYQLNVCGEGGEYETFTLDCPLFEKKIVIKESEVIETSGDVGYMNFKAMELVNKVQDTSVPASKSQKEFLCNIKVKKSIDYLQDLRLKEEEQQAEDQAKENSGGHHEACDRDLFQHNRLKPTCPSILEDNTSYISFSSGYLWSSVYSTSVDDAMRKLKTILHEKGVGLEHIVRVKMFVKNMKDYLTYNREYSQYFSCNPPTRTCVEIPLDGEVEVCMDVVVWKENLIGPESPNHICPQHRPFRTTLHVQSISHWAPANIGPYSQAVKIGDLIIVAGMIGLIPGDLEILKGGVELQARLALRHIGRILAAVKSKADIRSVVQGVCYVTSLKDIAVAKRMMARVSESQISTYVVVPALPKNALIEWHTWAHLANDQFDYEERGYSEANVNVTLRRRISCDNSVCVLISTASCQNSKDLSQVVLEEMITYCLRKMNTGQDMNLPMNLTMFFKSYDLSTEFISHTLKMCPPNVSKFIVPVLAVEDKTTLLSIVLTRH